MNYQVENTDDKYNGSLSFRIKQVLNMFKIEISKWHSRLQTLLEKYNSGAKVLESSQA